MVIIREKKNKHGNLSYILTEMETGMERRWNPPQTILYKTHTQFLFNVAMQLDNDASKLRYGHTSVPEPDPDVLTLAKYGRETFIPSIMITHSPNTVTSWKANLASHVYPLLGNIPLADIKVYQIYDLLERFQASGYAYSSVIKLYTVLSRFFAHAAKREVIERNPMLLVERPRPRKDEQIQQAPSCYTAEQIGEILALVDQENLKWRTFVRIMSDTGIRRGECCALRWEDVDFRSARIKVHASVGYTPEAGLYVSTTKNRQIRELSLAPEIMELLLTMYVFSNSPYIFPNRDDNSQPMAPQSATQWFRQFGKKHNIDRFHPHKLRHTFASIAITHGADVASVSELLGHGDKSFTLRTYTHSNNDRMDVASNIQRSAIQDASSLKKAL